MPARTRTLMALCAAIALPCLGQEPSERRALFGDLHIHTNYSFDAFTASVRTTPDDAYLFAKGHPIAHPSGGTLRISGRPLDFLAVTDHAEFLGVHAALLDPSSPTYGHPSTDDILPKPGTTLTSAIRQMRRLIDSGDEVAGEAVIADSWLKTIEAAERHNDPGTFTTFVGFEYTPSVGARHLHRNVIFRGANPDMPFSSRDSENPEDLWAWLDALRDRGIEAMAIPHNMNQSDGLAFQEQTFGGDPIDRDWAEKRIRNEPVAEISQQKGTSETHPSLSPNDEWADFQIVQYYLNRAENKDPISIFKGGYYRDALRMGLEFEERLGVNPYQLGVVAASDSHTTAAAYEEDNHFSSRSNTPQARGSAYLDPDKGWEGFFTPRQATHGTGGLTGVWAEDNTREAIYDAMRRKESFGTSGPRIRVRLFGGFGLDRALDGAADPIDEAYRTGHPMGSVLPATESGAPSFLVWAMRDPETGWLQRAQVIKGWMADGESHERVFDVACSDGLEPDPSTHRCPDNGARVNLSDCSVSRDRGAVELQSVWTDPDFRPSQRAFYYVRVLENPSCRWSTWDALRLGIEPNPDLPATHQERAWSSPIWYQPE